jgi:putative endopeptidase
MSLFRRRSIFVILSVCLIVIAVVANRQAGAWHTATDNATFETSADNPQQSVVAGFDFSNIDRSVSACEDFNKFANGGWMTKNPIPGAYSVWGRFSNSMNRTPLFCTISLMAAKGKPKPGNEQKIADFYGTCMDEAKIQQRGLNR